MRNPPNQPNKFRSGTITLHTKCWIRLTKPCASCNRKLKTKRNSVVDKHGNKAQKGKELNQKDRELVREDKELDIERRL